MKVSGYSVWQYEDGTSVSHDLEINTDGIFVNIRYGDVCIDTPHPVCRDMYDHLLTTVREHANQSVALGE